VTAPNAREPVLARRMAPIFHATELCITEITYHIHATKINNFSAYFLVIRTDVANFEDSLRCHSKKTALLLKNKKPTRCHLLFYCTSYTLNMFRALLCPSSGARDCDVDYHIGRFVLGLLYVGG